MECEGCGKFFNAGQNSDSIQSGCPNCGRPYHMQPSPTKSEMSLRNMPADGSSDDMGGNPLREGILADGGWNNSMKRDESFGSMMSAAMGQPMDDWFHNPDVQHEIEAMIKQLEMQIASGQTHPQEAFGSFANELKAMGCDPQTMANLFAMVEQRVLGPIELNNRAMNPPPGMTRPNEGGSPPPVAPNVDIPIDWSKQPVHQGAYDPAEADAGYWGEQHERPEREAPHQEFQGGPGEECNFCGNPSVRNGRCATCGRDNLDPLEQAYQQPSGMAWHDPRNSSKEENPEFEVEEIVLPNSESIANKKLRKEIEKIEEDHEPIKSHGSWNPNRPTLDQTIHYPWYLAKTADFFDDVGNAAGDVANTVGDVGNAAGDAANWATDAAGNAVGWVGDHPLVIPAAIAAGALAIGTGGAAIPEELALGAGEAGAAGADAAATAEGGALTGEQAAGTAAGGGLAKGVEDAGKSGLKDLGKSVAKGVGKGALLEQLVHGIQGQQGGSAAPSLRPDYLLSSADTPTSHGEIPTNDINDPEEIDPHEKNDNGDATQGYFGNLDAEGGVGPATMTISITKDDAKKSLDNGIGKELGLGPDSPALNALHQSLPHIVKLFNSGEKHPEDPVLQLIQNLFSNEAGLFGGKAEHKANYGNPFVDQAPLLQNQTTTVGVGALGGSDTKNVCPSCKAVLTGNEKVCPQCSRPVSPTVASVKTGFDSHIYEHSDIPPGMTIKDWKTNGGSVKGEHMSCPHCGSVIRDDKFGICPICGEEYHGFTPNGGQQEPVLARVAADHQGPHSQEQFAMMAQWLQEHGRSEEIPTMIIRPWDYAKEFAEVQMRQPPDDDITGQEPPPAQEEAPPGATMPMPGMDSPQGQMQSSTKISAGQCNCESTHCPHHNGNPGAGVEESGYDRCPNPADGSHRMQYVGDICPECAKSVAASGGAEYLSGPEPSDPQSHYGADSVAKKCPKCNGSTTGIVNQEDMTSRCHSCGHLWKQDGLMNDDGKSTNSEHTAAHPLEHALAPEHQEYPYPPEGDDNRSRRLCPLCGGNGQAHQGLGSDEAGLMMQSNPESCPRCDGAGFLYQPNRLAAHPELQEDFSEMPEHAVQGEPHKDHSRRWMDDNGAPLEPGKEYEMYSGEYQIPDIVRITSVRPDSIDYILQGDFGLSHQNEISWEEASTEGLSFQPTQDGDDAGDPKVGPQEMADQFDTNNTPYQGEPNQDDLSTPTRTSSRDWLKVGGKDYSRREQRELINEPGVARNIGDLDLTNTHYLDDDSMSESFIFGI